MNNSEINLLEEMILGRHATSTIFMQFTQSQSTYHCFFEGEDAKYYGARIRAHLGEDIEFYTAGNKDNVLKLWRRITLDSYYNSTITMFFVDRDFDDIPGDANEHLYITPCYSIENFYVNAFVFSRILNAEFQMSVSTTDFLKCKSDFECRLNEFIHEIAELNSLYYLTKIYGKVQRPQKLSGAKTARILGISIQQITRASEYDELIKDVISEIGINSDEYSRVLSEIRTVQNPIYCYRGKNLLDFLIVIINDLKEKNRMGGYFSEKRDRISINITNNRLSELSQYAETPICLKEFLLVHKSTM